MKFKLTDAPCHDQVRLRKKFCWLPTVFETSYGTCRELFWLQTVTIEERYVITYNKNDEDNYDGTGQWVMEAWS